MSVSGYVPLVLIHAPRTLQNLRTVRRVVPRIAGMAVRRVVNEAAAILTHLPDRLEQSAEYDEASRRHRCRMLLRVDYLAALARAAAIPFVASASRGP